MFRLEFESKKMLEKVEALSVERDRLQSEREDLKARNDELVDELKFGQLTKEKASLEGETDSGN